MHSVVFVFLDGFGMGECEPQNPLFSHGIPCLEKKIGSKIVKNHHVSTSDTLLKGIDPCLGIPGIPQSATGQTSLLTGKNAQATLGYHLPAFPNDQLISIIETGSILKKVVDLGLRATFANAYTDNYFERVSKKYRNSRTSGYSVTTHCVLAAGIPFRSLEDLKNNKAVYWDIKRTYLEKIGYKDIGQIDPFEAGMHLSRIGTDNELVLFECFAPDLAGHKGSMEHARDILQTLDSFLCGIIESMDKEMNLVVCSDHGNMEDLNTGSHTQNPVPLLVVGPDAATFRHVTGIDQITDMVIDTIKSRAKIQCAGNLAQQG